MAAKKKKKSTEIEALRSDIHALQQSFSRFRDAMLTDAALQQAEQQQAKLNGGSIDLPGVSDAEIVGAAELMSALGHPLRLHMAVMLAKDPASVTDIMDRLELSTTGAAYHHLKVLMSQGLVEQPQRGTFALTGDALPRVQQLLSGLFGVEAEVHTGEKQKKKDKRIT